MTGPPFFIVGSARSGTTLLRLILNAHPQVAVPPESRFIVELWHGSDRIDADRFLRDLAAHPRFQMWELPIRAVAAELGGKGDIRYREAIEVAFQEYAHYNGKSRWGDKTPRYVEDLDLLARLFPDARFIHLIRDGRNVALSYADVPFGPKTVGKAAALWAKRVRTGCLVGRTLGDRYIEIHYEVLTADAEGTTKQLCDFLGLEFDPGMLEYAERASASVLPRASMYNPHVKEPPRTNVRSWQDSMPEEHVEIFEAVAGDVLTMLDYERRFPEPSGRARIVARLSSTGLPVAKIRQR